MLVSKNIIIKVNGNMVKYYREKGYDCKANDLIEIDVNDLPTKSNVHIKVKCDYCGKEYDVRYCDYLKQNHDNACYECRFIKSNRTNINKYGSASCLGNKEIREKIKETMIVKYGVDNCMKNNEILFKTQETNLKRYGYKNVFQNEDVRKKQEETVFKKYGVDNVFKSELIKQKIRETNLEKYGVENPTQNEIIKNKIIDKSSKSKFINNSQICSKQQLHINNVLGGELNYLYEKFWLDIFFKDNNIYLEYNGSGHDIDVKYHKLTNKEFKIKEIKRYKILESKGLKQIVISSKKDKIPNDEILLSMKRYSYFILNNLYNNWIVFDIDEQCIRYNKTCIKYDFLTPIIFKNDNNPIVTTVGEDTIHTMDGKDTV